MKDRRIAALSVVLARRRRVDAELNEALARLRGEEAQLRATEQELRGFLDAQCAKLDEQSRRLKAMASGDTRVSPREYEAGVQWRDVLDEQCRKSRADWQRGCAALEQKEADVARAIGEIRANRMRIDAYDERIEALRVDAQRSAEVAEDEEAEERRARLAGGVR